MFGSRRAVTVCLMGAEVIELECMTYDKQMLD